MPGGPLGVQRAAGEAVGPDLGAPGMHKKGPAWGQSGREAQEAALGLICVPGGP